MIPKLRFFHVLLVSALVGVAAASDQAPLTKTLGPTGPPLSYRIQDVTIRLVRQAGFGPGGGYSIQVHGDGTGHYWYSQPPSPPEEWDLSISRPAIVDLLNAFYKARFFELDTSYADQYGVTVSQEGVVTTTVTDAADAGATILTIRVGSYEKSVSWSLWAPAELATLGLKVTAARMAREAHEK